MQWGLTHLVSVVWFVTVKLLSLHKVSTLHLASGVCGELWDVLSIVDMYAHVNGAFEVDSSLEPTFPFCVFVTGPTPPPHLPHFCTPEIPDCDNLMHGYNHSLNDAMLKHSGMWKK